MINCVWKIYAGRPVLGAVRFFAARPGLLLERFSAILLMLAAGACAALPPTLTLAPAALETTAAPPGRISNQPALMQKTPTVAPPPTATPKNSREIPALPEAGQVIAHIPNQQPWNGREGEPRPDWLGWGAAAFTVAPDGSFWMVDTAASPQRLLQFNPQGDLLRQVSLDTIALGVYDIAISEDAIWLVDLANMPPEIIQLTRDGQFVQRYEIPARLMAGPDGQVISNGLFNIWPAEGDALMALIVAGLYRLEVTDGRLQAQPRDHFSGGGHVLRVLSSALDRDFVGVLFDDRQIELQPPLYLDGDALIGFDREGGFAISTRRETPKGDGVEVEWLVQAHDPSGTLKGVGRIPSRFEWVDFNHDVAVDPQGNIYQVVSYPDHSVNIIRLGLSLTLEDLPPLPTPTATPQPTPLSPRLNVMETLPPGASDQEMARQALARFFALLSERRYDEATPLFGGVYEDVTADGRLPGETPAAFWQRACTLGMVCTPVLSVVDEQRLAEDEFKFYVEFLAPDWFYGDAGTTPVPARLEIGACCGGSQAAQPPVWQFPYTVKKIAGQWKVMRGPVYLP